MSRFVNIHVLKMRGKKSGERWKKKKARMANKAAKGRADEVDKQEEEVEVPLTRREEESEEDNDQESASDSESSSSSDSDSEAEDGPKAKRAKSEAGKKWRNRQRVLVFGSRGIGARDRHLMDDLRSLLPHSRADSKMQRKETLFAINEIAEMKNCNKCLFFEGRRGRQDLYLWASSVARGPSAKFQVENVHTMAELKMTGNCLRGSRPLLTFDQSFEKEAHLRLLKELFTQIFSVPNHHPKSQPFFDHVYTFSVVDDKVWFRNFQIVEEDGSLAEIGPRFVLNPVKVFDASFSGRTLWDNPRYVTPTAHRFISIYIYATFSQFLIDELFDFAQVHDEEDEGRKVPEERAAEGCVPGFKADRVHLCAGQDRRGLRHHRRRGEGGQDEGDNEQKEASQDEETQKGWKRSRSGSRCLKFLGLNGSKKYIFRNTCCLKRQEKLSFRFLGLTQG